jgi:putative membrane protein
MWSSVQRWRGLILIGFAVVATLWLAAGSQLVLYIHPRYVIFTAIMATLALVFVVAGLVVKGYDEESTPAAKGWRGVLGVLTLAICAMMLVAMVALPPATLSSATAQQRDINGSGSGSSSQTVSNVSSAPAGAFAKFTVQDWASLLRQTNDLSFYEGKPVNVVGFITPDSADPSNVFYVSRFVITCCAVDAQPIGVPVYMANWTSSFHADDWVRATGSFVSNPSHTSQQSIALVPASVNKMDTPSDPYLY